MSDKKLPIVINSSDLALYKLPKPIRAVLERADKLRDYMVSAGKTPTNDIRVFRKDYEKIDEVVRQMSAKKFTAATVNWGGGALALPARRTAQAVCA